jgi:hypothetical protein
MIRIQVLRKKSRKYMTGFASIFDFPYVFSGIFGAIDDSKKKKKKKKKNTWV